MKYAKLVFNLAYFLQVFIMLMMIILCIISIIILIIAFILFKKANNIKITKTDLIQENENKIIELNEQIEVVNSLLHERKQHLSDLESHLNELNMSVYSKAQQISDLNNQLLEMQREEQKSLDDFKAITSAAKDQFFLTLEEDYDKKVQQYENDKQLLNNEIDALTNTLRARVILQQQERKVKENKDKYCIPCSFVDRADIKELKELRKQLSKPRILNMLIWQTYYQKPLTTLCTNVLGNKTVTGIYKITNQINNMSYIGQSKDIATRWKDHCKCGCGIDTPAGNKLYTAMEEYGLWNFSFELLEECKVEELNEKERNYIDIYDTKNNGYNSTIGNK